MRIRALTESQQKLILAVCQPESLHIVCKRLDMSYSTLQRRMQQLSRKMHCITDSRLEIVLTAIKFGLVDIDEDIKVGADIEEQRSGRKNNVETLG